MKFIKQTELSYIQKEQIFELWNSEYPEKLAYKSVEDFENYLNNLTEPIHYLLPNENGKIDAWAITFTRESETWFAIIISGKFQGKGIGTQILNQIKAGESILNGWVIDHNSDRKLNGNSYLSPLKFYKKNGFEILSEIRLELDVISAVKIKYTK